MLQKFVLPVAALLLGTLSGCGAADQQDNPESTSQGLRGLNMRESLAELDQIGEAIRSYYGPLEYKKARFGFDLDAALATARTAISAATTEADRVRPIYELLAKLKDGHVSFDYPLAGDTTSRASLPLIVTPVGGQYVVARAAAALTTVKRGDVLVSIDGLTVAQMEALLFPVSEIATPESSRHTVGVEMTIRPFYAPPQLRPRGTTARVVLKNEAGAEYTVDVPWRLTQGGLATQVTAPVARAATRGLDERAAFSGRAAYVLGKTHDEDSLIEFGDSVPHWLTPQVKTRLGLVEVTPKAATLRTFGVTVPAGDDAAPDTERFVWFRAYKYTFNQKTVLLVRIPSFETPKSNYDENVAWFAALLKDNMAPRTGNPSLADTPADTLIVDVTHNPGGAVPYLQGLASLLTTTAIPNFVQAAHADRKWIGRMLDQANASPSAAEQNVWLGRMRSVETAYDNGKWLTEFMPLTGSYQGPTVVSAIDDNVGANMLAPHPQVQWNKPVLVVHDELSGSAGDAFPAILQHAGVAKTFGAKTMGLGGTVELVLTLPYSNSELRLTRGLNAPFAANGAPAAGDYIENNGVTPNVPYAHTIADYRNGFVAYAEAFSAAAAANTR